jgi:hypothetical protein
MQNLRYAIVDAIAMKDWHHNDNAVSKARGDIAKYMSQMEKQLEVNRITQNEEHPHPYGRWNHFFMPRQAGKTAAFQAALHSCCPKTVYQLPPIPAGYELNIVGSLVTISPIQDNKV